MHRRSKKCTCSVTSSIINIATFLSKKGKWTEMTKKEKSLILEKQ